MKRFLTFSFLLVFVLPASVFAGWNHGNARIGPQRVTLPEDLAGYYGPLRSAAAIDTFVLIDEDFNSSNGNISNLPGWTTNDITGQLAIFWHVADAGELDGGTFGNLLPVAGSQSMWCGVDNSTAAPYCGYASLPGYGNGWDQVLESSLSVGDSISLSYKVFWDSEPGYDGTVVEYSFDAGTTWHAFPITDTLSARASVYDGISLTPYITETVTNQTSGTPGGNVMARFRFTSGGSWSDEDGLWPTDGAVTLDDINLVTYASGVQQTNDAEDFEGASVGDNVVGIWTGKKAPAFGDFAALYPGVNVVQEDPCLYNPLFMWGFFDNPATTAYSCHTPNPLPGQGAMPFGTADGVYMWNEVWTPAVTNTGSGVEYRLRFSVYKDLPLDNLQFFIWRVRSWIDDCPGEWRNHNIIYYGGHRFWTGYQGGRFFEETIGDLIDANADEIQIAVGAVDMCPFWCNAAGGFGSGACHSHAPLIDDVKLIRVGTFGPQFGVRHIDLFQDNFSGDGTLTGTAMADAAQDILPVANPGILPGDSVTMWISPVHASSGSGPSAWLYARVQNSNHAAFTTAQMTSGDGRTGKATRFPYVGSWTDANSNVWYYFQMDSVFTDTGVIVADRYCVDLNDALFVPGDTIMYFLGADADGTPSSGNESYWHRTLDGQGDDNLTADREEAAASPCEFTILPAGGYNRDGDILYVDDMDDRGGPAQLYFDSSFDLLGILDKVDRFDVLGPSSQVGNSLASRVTGITSQIIAAYKKIIWNSGNLEAGLIGDGAGNVEKSNDFNLLYQFLHTSSRDPGLYISGDDMAEEWATLGPTNTAGLKGYIPFTLLGGDHIVAGEAVSPTLTASVGGAFAPLGVPDQLVIYGGCLIVNDFDVVTPTGGSVEEFPYPIAGAGNSAVVSKQTTNGASATATVVFSTFSYHYIRDVSATFPPARVTHLKRILTKLGNVVPDATGVPDDGPQFTNYLETNYPNPFNPTTTIRYGVKDRTQVSLKVYNVAGQLVRTLVDGIQTPAAAYKVDWHGDNDAGQLVASGVYFYRLVTKDFVQTRKMVLLK